LTRLTVLIDVAVRDRARVAEGPFWDAATGRLVWVDILSGVINTIVAATGERGAITLPTLVGAAIPKRSGGFVAATAEGFASVAADGRMSTRLSVLPNGQRMNDAKCDRQGRLWAGSTEMDFSPGLGALRVLDANWNSEVVLEGLTLPNGLDWSPDGRTFYLIDTMARELNAFDVGGDDATTLSRRRVLATFPESGGLPDGMTVDATGCLWIAMWGGGRLVRVSPEGELLTEVPMPVQQPSSCAFGGVDLDVLYVTSAREGLELPDDAADGSVFAITGLGAFGMQSTPFS
jgi:sugar lactone lactonase YvrE